VKLSFVALGGLGEIGLNMMAIRWNEDILVVDAGLMFPADDMPGVDYVIPDFSFLKTNRHQVVGIVLTHAHEDHIGALPYLLRSLDAPVFGTPFTLGMVRHRLEEHNLLSAVSLNEVHAGSRIGIGPFHVEFIRVSHSVVDGVALAIETPLGVLIHTGDFKFGQFEGGTDVSRLAYYGQQRVLALLSDSTNVEKEGYTPSERRIGRTLTKIAADTSGRIIVALFASSLVRIQQVVAIAAKLGRKVAFSGRSLEVGVQVAKDCGHLTIPEGIEIPMEWVGRYPARELFIITTGSQGEPMSALTRMAMGSHKQIQIQPGDTVILSSKFIPGNERAITQIIDHLFRQGADVVYEKISDIHVSGHAFREELKLMIQLTRPQYFTPIHGEYRHLVLHARLALGMGIPPDRVLMVENGQVVEFDETGGGIGEKVPTGRTLIDGKGIGDVGNSVLRERRALGQNGLVVVILCLDEETGTVVHGPEVISRGFVFETETGHLIEDAVCVVLELLEEAVPFLPNRVEWLRAKMQSALKQYFFYAIGRRPVVLPFIIEV
jgi:ribonuclease J